MIFLHQLRFTLKTEERDMKKSLFVPTNFDIPPILETERFRLRMLSVDDVEKDYEAVIQSRELLHSMFGSGWPREGFTLKENLADLEGHQQEFLNREAFAYTVVSLDESRVLGCVYINPARRVDADAEVYMWVRQSEYDQGLDEVLFQTLKNWMISSWPFAAVAYPGRE
jgi:RimJ/RimL family protein N-acetyltransferase